MVRELRIAVVGYGIGGIAAAIQLRRLGHNIQHFDRNAPPANTGAGMLLHPPAQSRLAQLGILEDAIACGAPVRHISAKTTSGREIMALSYPKLADGNSGLGIQRGTLHRLLSCADEGKEHVRTGCEIESVDPATGTMFDSGGVRHGPFDLVVVADGTHSVLRRQLRARVRVYRLSDSAALVGLVDDPHSMSPQLGIGAQLALDDAAILANAIDGNRNVITALSNYQQTRPQQLRRLHRISRMVTPLFQSQNGPLSFFRTHVLGKVMHVPAIKQLTREILLSR